MGNHMKEATEEGSGDQTAAHCSALQCREVPKLPPIKKPVHQNQGRAIPTRAAPEYTEYSTGVPFALIVKIPLSQIFYTSTASDASD